MQYCINCGRIASGRFCQFCGYDNAFSITQSFQGPPLRPLPKKATAAMVLAIISLILLIIAGALSWWYLQIEGESEEYDYWYDEYIHNEIDAHMDFRLDEIDVEMTSVSNGDKDELDESGDLSGDMEDVGDTAGLFMIVGIVMLILSIIFIIILLAMVRIGNITAVMYTRLMKNLALLFVFLTFIIILIAPIYYIFAWPEAVEDDMNQSSLGSSEVKIYDGSFIGSESFDDTVGNNDVKFESRWGPGIGWILVLFCILLLLITIGLIKSGGNDALKLVEETSTIQPAQYVPGSQQYQVYQTPRYYNQNASGLSPQPQPSQPNPPTEVTCPNCKYRIAVLIRSLPASVKCPQCGTKGIIK
jgi:hypothetical protein